MTIREHDKRLTTPKQHFALIISGNYERNDTTIVYIAPNELTLNNRSCYIINSYGLWCKMYGDIFIAGKTSAYSSFARWHCLTSKV